MMKARSLVKWLSLPAQTFILFRSGNPMEMAHSIEGRVPFLDHHVVECAGRMPVWFKIRSATEKYLLREAAKPVITERVYRREKHPFHTPLMTTAPKERLHQMVQDTLRSSLLSAIPFYDQKKVVAVLDQIPVMSDSDRIAWDPALIWVLSACVLQEKFGMDLTTAKDDTLDEDSGLLTGW